MKAPTDDSSLVVKYSGDSSHEGVRAIVFRKGEILVFGRSSQSDVVLDSPKISRQHFRLEWIGEKPQVADCGSLNGTKLNGARVSGTASLAIGDCLRVSGLAFHVLDPETDEVRRLKENGQFVHLITSKDEVAHSPHVQEKLIVAAGGGVAEDNSQLAENIGQQGVFKLLIILFACVLLLAILLFFVS